MTVGDMRERLRSLYGRAPRWVRRVDGMSENQVIAVYHRMLKTGAFDGSKH